MIFEWVPPILVYYIQFILWISSCTAVLGRSLFFSLILVFLRFRTLGDLEVHSGSRPPERTSRTLDRHARTPRCAGQSVRVQLGVPFGAKLDKAKRNYDIENLH